MMRQPLTGTYRERTSLVMQAVSTRPQRRSRQPIRPLLLCSCYHLLFGAGIEEFQRLGRDLFIVAHAHARGKHMSRGAAKILLQMGLWTEWTG